ncbi:MAG TPA: hypothetical protein DEF61_04700 [Firmicutes bacterium]|nr:hypothetical protein [Bacillota bacterium]
MKRINYKKNIKKGLLPSISLSILVSLLLTLLFSTLSSPRRENKVEILIGANGCNRDNLISRIKENKQEYIYQINISSYESSSDLFLTYYLNTLGDMDITLLPESVLELGAFKTNISKYAVLDLKIIEKYMDLSSFSFYEKEEKKYGIKVYDPKLNTGILSNFIQFEETPYYLFISSISKHGGELTNAKNDGLFDILRTLLDL